MARNTIGWSEWSWNPMRGCRRKSEGCEHCYAESMAHRQNHPGGAYEGLTVHGKHGVRWSGKARFVPEKLADPLRLRKPQRIFVASMSDPFYADFTDEEIAAVWGVMALAHWHTFIVVTKRVDRAPDWLAWVVENGNPAARCVAAALERLYASDNAGAVRGLPLAARSHVPAWPLPNVQLFVSAENQERLDERTPHLAKCDVAVRGLSVEPLLGPVDLRPYLPMLNGGVFVGGESGARKTIRDCHIDWIGSVVEQCVEAGRPVFVKQLGSRVHDSTYKLRLPLLDFKGADPREWPEHLRVQTVYSP